MAEQKTKPTSQKADDFLNTIQPERKRKDSFALLKIFEDATGEKAVMWGPSIVGFGKFHYKSEKGTSEGDWPIVGFSPRKQSLTLYVITGNKKDLELFEKLGKHTTSKACLYINNLSDVDNKALSNLIRSAYKYTKSSHK